MKRIPVREAFILIIASVVFVIDVIKRVFVVRKTQRLTRGRIFFFILFGFALAGKERAAFFFIVFNDKLTPLAPALFDRLVVF